MSVGIYDMDMSTYTIVPFNLEAMKLSAYYKKKREIVILAPSFTPEKNTQFFVRKDYNDGNFPRRMQNYKNVDYGGLAFTDNVYFPLPEEIEKMKPDTSLYTNMEKAFLNSGVADRKKIFQNQMNGEHGRLSLDGKTIWDGYMKQFNYLPAARDLILHDYDLGAIDGGFEEVKKLLSKARTDGWATKIGMKFPVQISEGRELLNWSSLNPNRTFYSIQFNGIVDDDSWYEYITRCKQRSIYFNLEYNITGNNMTQSYLCGEGLRRILRQVILARSQRINFSLKYIDSFFFDERWENVILLMQYYLTSMTNKAAAIYFNSLPVDTVFDFARKTSNTPDKRYGGKCLTKTQIRQTFQFLRENNYPLFQDLYELNLNRLQEEKHDWI